MPGDAYWPWLKAGLHLNGSDGATSFPDVRGHVFSRTGAVAISTAQSRYAGEGSAYFPGGSNDRVACPASGDFDIGTESIAISFSVYLLSLPAAGTVCRLVMVGTNETSPSFAVVCDEAGRLKAGVAHSAKNAIATDPGVLTLNTWHDLEVSVYKRQAYLFKNGVGLLLAGGIPGPMTNLNMPDFIGLSNGVRLGGDQSGVPALDASLHGYLSQVRIWCRNGRHTGDYTPDAGPFPEGIGDLHTVRPPSPQRLISAGTRPAWRAVRAASPALCRDVEHGGDGQIIGTTKNTGSPDYPVSRRVRLYRKRDGALVRQMWSDAAGNYHFDRLRRDVDYVVLSHDHTGVFNAVIADSITADVMP